MATYEKYVDDDMIVTAMLFSGMSQEDIRRRLEQNGGNARAALEDLNSPTAGGDLRKKFSLVKDWLDHVGTGNVEKMLTEGAGLDQADVQSAIYWAQREVGGTATPTLDRVLYHLGGITGKTKTQAAINFAATVRPALQTFNRGDTALMTTRTQYKTGQKPAPAAPPPGTTGAGPAPAPSPAAGQMAQPGGVTRGIKAGKPNVPLRQPAQPGAPTGALSGTLGGGGGNTGGQSAGLRALPTLSPNASEDEVVKYIKKYYGYSSWILDVPELRQRMIEVARDFAGMPVDESMIEGRFTDLDWWKTHSDQQRLAIEEKNGDPATYNAKVEAKYRELAVLTGQSKFSIGEARLRQIARDSYDQGWNQAEMRAALAAEFDYNPETGDQEQSALVGELRSLADDYLVPLSEKTIDQWGRQIIAGTSTNEDFTQYAKNMAKGMFAHYATDIDAGRTIKQIADPFVQMAARDLELTPDQINLTDPKWRKALELDPETGQPMQPSKWQKLIRSDSSYGWDYTQNARAEASEFASKIAEAFGR